MQKGGTVLRGGVALLAEGVDRNTFGLILRLKHSVALLAEGVDRNSGAIRAMDGEGVALLAEGVDRNTRRRMVDWEKPGRPPRGGRG